jgi:cytochrome o ubiquinol oxidase subunit II
MGRKSKLFAFVFITALLVAVVLLVMYRSHFAVLNPEGTIADQQRDLLIFASLLSLIVVIPVFFLIFFIAWKYRAGNKKAKYSPEWDHSHKLEFIWWGIPVILIVILAGITWKSSHDLDPYKPLASDKKPVTIQAVALEWKWLFIYPEQNIATVNYVEFPEKTPINFQITADAPMNSFWIPKLGGQVYAMAGMQTKLHLMANTEGLYDGSSANISGEGFAGMRFKARSSSEQNFKQWVDDVQHSPNTLTAAEYQKLAKQSKNNPQALYASYEPGLYDSIIMKYMAPQTETKKPDTDTTETMEGMHHAM